MIFKQTLHWGDGMFLQPHHIQQMQRAFLELDWADFSLSHHYPYGLIECELDEEMLLNMRLGLKRMSAIMPNGERVSLPGNAAILPFGIDIESALKDDEIMVYLAVPDYSADAPNEGDGADKTRLYNVKEYLIKDENSGSNEIALLKHQINAHLTTNRVGAYSFLEIARLKWVSKNISAPRLAVDNSYCPPYFIVSDGCPLRGFLGELVYMLDKKRAQLKEELAASGFNSDNLTGGQLYNIRQLGVINSYGSTLRLLLQTNKATPFEVYIKISELLGILSSLFPLLRNDEPMAYNHNDPMPCFKDMVIKIRSLIAAGGYIDYTECEFKNDGGIWRASIDEKDLNDANELYIAINTTTPASRLILAVENGDNFRLIAPSGIDARVRGARLKELRNPPRYLPAIRDAIWFELVKEQSSEIYAAIQKEGAAVIDTLDFDGFRASLFLVANKGE